MIKNVLYFKRLHGTYKNSINSVRAFISVYSADWKNKPPIFIFTAGKVGSTSVSRSISEAKVPFSVYDSHFLSASRIKKSGGWNNPRKPKHVLLSYWAGKRLRKSGGGRFITLMRDPVSHWLSFKFQVLEQEYRRGVQIDTKAIESKIPEEADATFCNYEYTKDPLWYGFFSRENFRK